MRYLVVILLALVAVVGTTAAATAEPRFTMEEIESELMCPTCQSRLDLSFSPAADRIRVFIEERRQAGWTKEEVKEALVADFGPAVLAAPPARGIGLLAWSVPLAVLLFGAIVVVVLGVVWRRRGGKSDQTGHGSTDPELDARVDAELARYDDESP